MATQKTKRAAKNSQPNAPATACGVINGRHEAAHAAIILEALVKRGEEAAEQRPTCTALALWVALKCEGVLTILA